MSKKMARRRGPLGFTDDDHRAVYRTLIVEAEAQLGRVRRAKSCRDRSVELRTAAETLAEANAHLYSVTGPTKKDTAKLKRLRDLNRTYAVAWSRFRDRCVRK